MFKFLASLFKLIFSKEGGKTVGMFAARTMAIGVTTQVANKANSLGKGMSETNEKDMLALVELAKIKQ